MRIEQSGLDGNISIGNPQTLREYKRGFFMVPLANLAVSVAAVAGTIGLRIGIEKLFQ